MLTTQFISASNTPVYLPTPSSHHSINCRVFINSLSQIHSNLFLCGEIASKHRITLSFSESFSSWIQLTPSRSLTTVSTESKRNWLDTIVVFPILFDQFKAWIAEFVSDLFEVNNYVLLPTRICFWSKYITAPSGQSVFWSLFFQLRLLSIV